MDGGRLAKMLFIQRYFPRSVFLAGIFLSKMNVHRTFRCKISLFIQIAMKFRQAILMVQIAYYREGGGVVAAEPKHFLTTYSVSSSKSKPDIRIFAQQVYVSRPALEFGSVDFCAKEGTTRGRKELVGGKEGARRRRRRYLS